MGDDASYPTLYVHWGPPKCIHRGSKREDEGGVRNGPRNRYLGLLIIRCIARKSFFLLLRRYLTRSRLEAIEENIGKTPRNAVTENLLPI